MSLDPVSPSPTVTVTVAVPSVNVTSLKVPLTLVLSSSTVNVKVVPSPPTAFFSIFSLPTSGMLVIVVTMPTFSELAIV